MNQEELTLAQEDPQWFADWRTFCTPSWTIKLGKAGEEQENRREADGAKLSARRAFT